MSSASDPFSSSPSQSPAPTPTPTPTPPSSASELLQRIESSRLFQASVIFIIVLSAISIGAKTYDLPPFFESILSALDMGITFFFLAEILLRFSV